MKTQQDKVVAAVVRQVRKWNLTIRKFECKFETRKMIDERDPANPVHQQEQAFAYHIVAARRGTGTRGGQSTHRRYWKVDNLLPAHRDIINALPKE